jgi:hypothetical protein
MEITDPDGDTDDPWYVTNGLLVVELATGRMQVGDDTIVQHEPSTLPVAGDLDSLTAPSYATIDTLLVESGNLGWHYYR